MRLQTLHKFVKATGLPVFVPANMMVDDILYKMPFDKHHVKNTTVVEHYSSLAFDRKQKQERVSAAARRQGETTPREHAPDAHHAA
eukprot:6175103-Pleurochrysis_carterae.AAC.2